MIYRNINFNKSNSFLDIIKNINFTLIIVILFLFFIGCLVLYSASGGNLIPLVQKHVIKFIFSLLIFFMLCFFNYNLIKNTSYYMYIFSVLSLIFLIFFGLEIAGSKRWINLNFISIQPAEFAKVFLVLAISKYYSDFKHFKNSSIFKLVIPTIMIVIPFLFIVYQPDLGTSILLLANGICLIVLSGISFALIILGVILFLGSIPIAWNQLYDYQKQRIITFLNPENDPLGSGYHIAQSKIAIGSGGFTGKGYMQGSQSQLEFIPEIHTDFVFSVFSEEFGLIGAFIVIVLYLYIIIYGLYSSFKSSTLYDKLVIFGLTINFFFYFVINISMVIGIVPVVGVPLPIVSYGGSSMLAVLISLGIIERININRRMAN